MKKLKILLVVFVLTGFALLSSCMFPGPGYGHHGNGNQWPKEHPGNNGHGNNGHGNNGHHEQEDHHDS